MQSITEYKPTILDPTIMLSVYESELEKAEKTVAEYKRKINLLRKANRGDVITQITDFDLMVANLKWRAEIRHCLNLPHKNLMTSKEIASCVAIRNDLPGINRNISTKISSTLSMLHSDLEIGRATDSNGDFVYGRKEYFEQDLKTVLPKWKDFLIRNWK